MAISTTFVLKEPKSESPSLIYLIIRYNSSTTNKKGKKIYNQFKFSISDRWNPKHWNFEKHCGINKKEFPDPSELNQRLMNIRAAVENICRRLVNDEIEITDELIRNELNKRTDLFPDKRQDSKTEVKNSTPSSLVAFYEQYLAEVKFIYKRGRPFPITDRTRQKYATTLRHLKEFEIKQKKVIKFEQIDKNFYQEFVNYLRTVAARTKSKKGSTPEPIKMTENTVGKHIGMLKTIMEAARRSGINITTEYVSKEFAKPYEEIMKIYLTGNELLKMYNLDLSGIKYLERVRDVFLIGCYTCLRFSDFSNLKQDNIYKNDQGVFLKVTAMKTEGMVVIPLHWIVSSILEKYNYDLPRGISNQKMNDYLKEIGEKAGINEPVCFTRTEGGVRVPSSNPKYKLITTHTARRSGATNMFLAGIPAISIMKITGHKTEQSFMRYIQMTQEDNANLLIKHPFFSDNQPKTDN